MVQSDQIRVIILGAGKGGSSLLEILHQLPHVKIVSVMDKNPRAHGLELAKSLNIPVADAIKSVVAREDIDLIIDVTGDPAVSHLLDQHRHPKAEVLKGTTSKLLWDLVGHEKQMETNLIQAEKLALIGTFVSSIAHDVNNPLYIILGLAQNIEEETESLQIKAAAQSIVSATKRIAKMCQGLTLYSRKPASSEYIEDINLNHLMEEALNIARYAVTMKDITVAKRLSESPVIRANQDEILQMLVNLVINAVHAMEGRNGTLTLHSELDNGTVCLKITDTGTGIPEKHLRNLFVPFFTTKPPGVGTGLGLYSAKTITEKYGGHISVQSEVEKGTTFAIHFPSINAHAS